MQLSGPQSFWHDHVVNDNKITLAAYCELWQPSWDWMLHVYGLKATREQTMAVLRTYAAMHPPPQEPAAPAASGGGRLPGASVVLQCILVNMPPAHLSAVAVQVLSLLALLVQKVLSLLVSLRAGHVSAVAVQLVTLINEQVACDGGAALSKKMHLYGLLGRSLVAHPPPLEVS